MKKNLKLLTLLSVMALLSGCAITTPSVSKDSQQQGQDTSEQIADKSSEDKASEGKTSEKNSSKEDSGYTPVEHTHAWDSAWTSDADYHWHKCTADLAGAACGEINDKAAHTWEYSLP